MAVNPLRTYGPRLETSSASTIVYTLGVGEHIDAGETAFIVVSATGSTSAVAVSATDSHSNTYVVDNTQSPSSSVAISLLRVQPTTQLVHNDTITVTLGASTTDRRLDIRVCSGVTQAGSPLDQSAAACSYVAGSTGTAITSGQDIKAIINAGAVNQEFNIGAGEYRITGQITPKAGMRILGAGSGSVKINGSKLLTGWTGSGPYTHSGTLPGPTTITPVSPSYKYPQNQFAQQVLWDGAPLWRCGAKVAGTTYGSTTPATGEYYIDWDADTVKLFDDPTGHTVEIMSVGSIITGTAANVEVAGIEVYGGAQRGIKANGPGWNIHDCLVDCNLIGVGIPGQPTTVTRCHITTNGMYGMNGSGDGQTVTDNEIDHNGTLKLYEAGGSAPIWGGIYGFGGFKFSSTIGMAFRRNTVHDNEGGAAWWDVNCENIVIDGNEVYNNVGNGIWYEISYSATITNNLSYNNGDAGIYISTSQGCTVSGNTVWLNGTNTGGNAYQIRTIDANRPQGVSAGHTFPHRGVDNTITGNTIFMLGGGDGITGTQINTGGSSTWPTDVWTRTTWASNIYHLPSSTTGLWSWLSGARDETAWKGYGNDPTPAASYTGDLPGNTTRPSPALPVTGMSIQAPIATIQTHEYALVAVAWNGSATITADPDFDLVVTGHYDNGLTVKQVAVYERVLTASEVESWSGLLSSNQPWAMVLATYAATLAKPAARGLSTRDKDKAPTGYEAAYSNLMHDVYWGTPPSGASQNAPLQATNGGALNTTELAAIDALLTAAQSAGDTMTFRVFCGQYSPDWLKTLVGTFLHADTNAGNTPAPKSVARFWVSAYQNAYDDFMNKLGAHFDANPTLVGVHHGLAQMYYPEPLQRHTSAQANRSELVGGGGGWTGADANGNGGTNIPVGAPGRDFSFALDMASQKKSVDIHATRWPTTPMHFAFNPWQVLYSQTEAGITYANGNQKYWGGDQTGIPNTKAIIDYAVTVLAPSNRIVLENNSMRDSFFRTTKLNGAQAVSASTLTVGSTSSFSASGTAWVVKANTYGVYSEFTYTGKTATTFTGCSGGSGNYANGDWVVQLLTDGQGLMYSYFNTKAQCAKYYQMATYQRVQAGSTTGNQADTMRWLIAAQAANACEPTNYASGDTNYTATILAAQDAGLKLNALPAGGHSGHVPLSNNAPVIAPPTGGYTSGTILTTDVGTWIPGTDPISDYEVTWYRVDPATQAQTTVQGPTSYSDPTSTDQYTIVSGDLSNFLQSGVVATNVDGASAEAFSALTPLVVTPAAPAPTNLTLPVGTPSAPVSGDVITWSTGTWTGTPILFTWTISRSNDGGSTWVAVGTTDPNAYQTTDADIGYAFQAVVVANNGQDSSPATSAATSSVTAQPVITIDATASTLPGDVTTYTITGNVQPRGTGVTITSFTRNGVAVTLAGDGSFSDTVPVAVGTNTYTYLATDSAAETTSTDVVIVRSTPTTGGGGGTTTPGLSADVAYVEVRIRQRGLG